MALECRVTLVGRMVPVVVASGEGVPAGERQGLSDRDRRRVPVREAALSWTAAGLPDVAGGAAGAQKPEAEEPACALCGATASACASAMLRSLPRVGIASWALLVPILPGWECPVAFSPTAGEGFAAALGHSPEPCARPADPALGDARLRSPPHGGPAGSCDFPEAGSLRCGKSRSRPLGPREGAPR